MKSPLRLPDDYRICCFVELILQEKVPARKSKHSLSLDGRGLGWGEKVLFSIDYIPLPPPASPERAGSRWRAGFIPSSPRRRLSEPEAARGGESWLWDSLSIPFNKGIITCQ